MFFPAKRVVQNVSNFAVCCFPYCTFRYMERNSIVFAWSDVSLQPISWWCVQTLDGLKNGICKGLSVIMGQVKLRNFAMFLSSSLILERSGSSTCADNLMNPYIIVSVYWPLRSCLLIKNLC